jgi:cytochrome c oxidase cbb3-type subunit 4
VSGVTFHSFWTVVMLVLFIGIIAWAWSSKRKKAFDEAARLPLDDGDNAAHGASGEKKHG